MNLNSAVSVKLCLYLEMARRIMTVTLTPKEHVSGAFARKEQAIGLFFGLEKAYRQFGNMVPSATYRVGLRERLSLFVSEYIRERRVWVRIGSTLSKLILPRWRSPNWWCQISREISFFHNICFNNPIVLKVCTEHGSVTAMLSAKFQNDWTTETDMLWTRFRKIWV